MRRTGAPAPPGASDADASIVSDADTPADVGLEPVDASAWDAEIGAPDAGGDARPPSRIGQVPGLLLWLAAEDGIGGTVMQRWPDRAHPSEALDVDFAEGHMPLVVSAGDHAAVTFSGSARFALRPQPGVDPRARLLGETPFFVAVVAAAAKTSRGDAILFGAAQYLPFGGPPVSLDPNPGSFITIGQRLAFNVGGSSIATTSPDGRSWADGEVRIYSGRFGVSAGRQLRVNGKVLVAAEASPPVSGDDRRPAALYVGGWDFDLPMFRGSVLEVVVLEGPAADDEANVFVIEEDLLARYGDLLAD
jgi:hypothetical protein